MTTSTTIVASRVYDLINNGDIDSIIATLTDDYVSHGFGGGGSDNLRQSLTSFRNAFPDVVFTVDDTITEGDKVAVKTTFRATHQGPFAGVPASGRPVEVGGCDVFRIRAGKIAEAWWLGDSGSMLMQIGAVPAPAAD